MKPSLPSTARCMLGAEAASCPRCSWLPAAPPLTGPGLRELCHWSCSVDRECPWTPGVWRRGPPGCWAGRALVCVSPVLRTWGAQNGWEAQTPRFMGGDGDSLTTAPRNRTFPRLQNPVNLPSGKGCREGALPYVGAELQQAWPGDPVLGELLSQGDPMALRLPCCTERTHVGGQPAPAALAPELSCQTRCPTSGSSAEPSACASPLSLLKVPGSLSPDHTCRENPWQSCPAEPESSVHRDSERQMGASSHDILRPRVSLPSNR